MDKAERLRQLVHDEHPTARSEIHEGVLRIAIGQGEARCVHVVPLPALDATTPEEVCKRISDAVQRGRGHREP